MAFVAYGFSHRGVQTLDCVGRVDDLANLSRKAEERYDRFPVASPALRDCRIFAAPGTLIKSLEVRGGGLGIGRSVDRSKLAGDLLTFLPRGKLHRIADQMHDAGLHDGVRENRGNRLWEALQTIDDGDQDILGAA